MEQQDVLQILTDNGVDFQVTEHAAAYTIEEIEKMHLPYIEDVCKNLFLRDAKGHRFFLVVLDKDKRADLSALQLQLGCTKLSFASEDRLKALLKLEKGSVTPLGILNDTEHKVEVVFDSKLVGSPRLAVHPCVNTATVWLSYDDLLRVIMRNGNIVRTIRV